MNFENFGYYAIYLFFRNYVNINYYCNIFLIFDSARIYKY